LLPPEQICDSQCLSKRKSFISLVSNNQTTIRRASLKAPSKLQLLCFALAVASLSSAAPPQNQPSDEAALGSLITRYYAAYSKKDLGALVIVWSQRSPDLRAGIEEALQAMDRGSTALPMFPSRKSRSRATKRSCKRPLTLRHPTRRPESDGTRSGSATLLSSRKAVSGRYGATRITLRISQPSSRRVPSGTYRRTRWNSSPWRWSTEAKRSASVCSRTTRR
jgi:hypothetical protein